MALINGIYIHVTDEDVDESMEISTHSVEDGIDITDHTKCEPTELSLSGEVVNYTGYVSSSSSGQITINAWVSLVKKDGTAFESMSFERLNNELVAFEGGTNWVDTGAVQYIDGEGNLVNCSTQSNTGIYAAKFEVTMPYEGTVRVQNAYTEYCCFNIINKSTTGYNVRDYDADSEDINDFVLSNTYNGETGRIRTTFTNYDTDENGVTVSEERTAAWVLEVLKKWQKTSTLVTYEGRNYVQNYLIKNLSTGHPNKITGGASFSMKLVQFRSASNSYMDESGAVANGGNQQISNGDNSDVWYTVQVGDEIYNLVGAEDAPYKSLNRPQIDGADYDVVSWVMLMNEHAFEIPGDCSTLRAYVDILLGYR